MKLPYRNKAFIPKQKLSHYLLSQTHPIGRFKAKLFQGLGFDRNNSNLLEKSLLAIAWSEEVQEIISSPYGTKYIIDGKINIVDKKRVVLRTVWIIEKGKKEARFVTVYPV